MNRLVHKIFGGIETPHLDVAVLLVAAASLITIGYVLLAKSSDSTISDRRR